MNNKQKDLILIYNAKSGIFHGIIDYLHKIFSPETYECDLCVLTYNNFGKISKWKKFLDSSNYNIVFAYKDHLDEIGIDGTIELPTILLSDRSILISASDIHLCKSLDELIDLLESRIKSL